MFRLWKLLETLNHYTLYLKDDILLTSRQRDRPVETVQYPLSDKFWRFAVL